MQSDFSIVDSQPQTAKLHLECDTSGGNALQAANTHQSTSSQSRLQLKAKRRSISETNTLEFKSPDNHQFRHTSNNSGQNARIGSPILPPPLPLPIVLASAKPSQTIDPPAKKLTKKALKKSVHAESKKRIQNTEAATGGNGQNAGCNTARTKRRVKSRDRDRDRDSSLKFLTERTNKEIPAPTDKQSFHANTKSGNVVVEKLKNNWAGFGIFLNRKDRPPSKDKDIPSLPFYPHKK